MKRFSITAKADGQGFDLQLFASVEAAYMWSCARRPVSDLRQSDGAYSIKLYPGQYAEIEWIGLETADDAASVTVIDKVRVAYEPLFNREHPYMYTGWMLPEVMQLYEHETPTYVMKQLSGADIRLPMPDEISHEVDEETQSLLDSIDC